MKRTARPWPPGEAIDEIMAVALHMPEAEAATSARSLLHATGRQGGQVPRRS